MIADPIAQILNEMILDCYILKKAIVCPRSAIQLAIVRIRASFGSGVVIPQSVDDSKVQKSYDSVSPGKVGRPPKAHLSVEDKEVVETIKLPSMNKVFYVKPKEEKISEMKQNGQKE